MMYQYYLNSNQQANGDHEVHRSDCTYLPAPANQIALGAHSGCNLAVAKARQMYPSARINGCAYCSPLCHTS